MKINFAFIARLWFYFRMGYSTYLAFLLGYLSTLVTVYYLAIKNIPMLLDAFPHFVPFAILATFIGGPVAIAIGWTHIKKSLAYSSEIDIGVEANPYYYKLAEGYLKEVVFPLNLEMLRLTKLLLEDRRLLSPSAKSRVENLEQNLTVLINGGTVGVPRVSVKRS